MRRAEAAFRVATIGSLALLVVGPLARRVEMVGADDLSTIWAGPRALVLGLDPYDAATWSATAVSLGTQMPATAVYGYPPWVAVALAPLGLLPLPVVSAVWLVASLAAALAATRLAVRRLLPGRAVDHALVVVALLLSWAGMLTLVLGQWGYLLVAALFAATIALRDGRAVLAGALMSAMVLKPHLFLFAAPAFAAHALWRDPASGSRPRGGVTAVLVAGTVALSLVAVGWLALPSWWPAYPALVGEQQTRPYTETLPALLLTVAGPGAVPLAAVLLALVVTLGLRLHPRSDAWLPVWISVSLALAPYTNHYDQLLLLVPIVLAAGALHARRLAWSRAVLWSGAGVLLVLTPGMYALAVLRRGESYSVVVPLAVMVLLFVALWPLRRAVTPDAVPPP